MPRPSQLRLRLGSGDDVRAALDRAGLRARPVLVLVGGADGLGQADEERVSALFRDHVVPALVRCGAGVVDGGTDSGVMRAMGSARSVSGAGFPLVGVVAAGTVTSSPDDPAPPADVRIDPHHSHVVLVPGDAWGDESPWLSAVAEALSAGRASATLLLNGGDVAYDDVQHSLAAGRPVVVVAGSGRTADAIASAVGDRRAGGSGDASEGGDAAGDEAGAEGSDERARRAAASPLVRVLSLDGPAVIAATLDVLLTDPTSDG